MFSVQRAFFFSPIGYTFPRLPVLTLLGALQTVNLFAPFIQTHRLCHLFTRQSHNSLVCHFEFKFFAFAACCTCQKDKHFAFGSCIVHDKIMMGPVALTAHKKLPPSWALLGLLTITVYKPAKKRKQDANSSAATGEETPQAFRLRRLIPLGP